MRRTLSAGDLYATPWTYELLEAFVDARSPLAVFSGTIDWDDAGRGAMHLPLRDPRTGMAPPHCFTEG